MRQGGEVKGKLEKKKAPFFFFKSKGFSSLEAPEIKDNHEKAEWSKSFVDVHMWIWPRYS